MLSCLVIDDEPLARKQIESYIERTPFLRLAGSARNTKIAAAILERDTIDLVFLDIKMPKETGIDFLKSNQFFQQVVFITAYPEFALEGFELDVTDYLMKPVTYERFLKAAEKAQAKIGGSETIKLLNDKAEFIYVKHNQRYEKLLIAEILFVESMLNYIHIITAKKKYTVYSSLKNMESILPQSQFIKPHKSYLVALDQITVVEDQQIQVGSFLIPISRGNRQDVLKYLNLK